MNEDMSDIEFITWMELRFGPLTKTITGNYSMDKVDQIERELKELLTKYKDELKLHNPVPRIRMWVTDKPENTVHFLFFDKNTGKRVLLGQWLNNQEGYNEH